MAARLVALDGGPDIPVDRAPVVVGRHPQCDARLDSIRVSRRHCVMTEVEGAVEVRDLGSTNGIRINGQRVESGRLRPGDELSIAHIRFRLESGPTNQVTQADAASRDPAVHSSVLRRAAGGLGSPPKLDENPLAAVARELSKLPPEVVERYQIKIIVQVPPPKDDSGAAPAEPPSAESPAAEPDSAEHPEVCRSDSSP
jgi:hypothetical protein